MRSHMGIVLGSICLAVLSWPVCGLAATANLTAVADTFINAGDPGNNAGANAWFDAGTDGTGGVRRGLLRFDVSSIPAGSTITGAALQLTVIKVPGSGPVNSTFDLFKLLASWNEGTKDGSSGAPATTGEATWNARMQGTANWTTPGAKSNAATAASASAAVGSTFGAVVSWSGPGLTADVQFWVNNPSQVFGWLLTSRAESSFRSVRGFAAHENGSGAPTLVVGYTTPPPPNTPPSVSITSPASGATFVSPANVTIQAAASDKDGIVTKVEFFDGTISLGSVASSPYAKAVTLYPGTHPLTAVATDNDGAATTSATVTTTVITVPILNPIAPRIVKDDITIELQTIVDGLIAPLSLAVPDDGTGRMFVCDQGGLAWVVVNGVKLPTPLLDVRTRLVSFTTYDERGLLGLAIHPDFAHNPFIYTYTSEPPGATADFVAEMPAGKTINCQSVIAEWRMSLSDPNQIDPTSRREMLRIDKPQSNHNAGTLRFGPDRFLYFSLGDGGAANDVADGHIPGGNAQSVQRVWGKIHRIDVDGRNSANGKYGIPKDNPFVGQKNAVQEIFAYGLRNPYTYSFDRLTGDLYLGDAGQNNIEEVDLIVKGGNYGWNIKEGTFWFDSVSPNIGDVVTGPVRPVPSNLIDPIAEYDHDEGEVVIGGFVYRGTQIPALQGLYVFGDWGSFVAPSARLFFLDPNSVIKELRIGVADRPTGFWLRGFGQDKDGEMYVCGSTILGPNGNTGKVFKIVPSLPITYVQHNLVSDLPGMADRMDPNVINPWGIVAGPTTPLWIADNHTGVSSVYDGNGVQVRAIVTVPPPAGFLPPSAPTGVVFNATTDFLVDPNHPARFIFATEDGTISAFNTGDSAVLKVDNSASGDVYKGLALANSSGGNRLYATDFHNNRVDVFDAGFNPVALPGAFFDPNQPAGFAPFGIQVVGSQVYVTYAMQDADKHDDVSGAGNGYVSIFDPNGLFLRRFASNGPLNSPWGITPAPAGFGGFGGALLVGNFGDGRINAFNPTTGAWLGTMEDTAGKAISIEGLWGLTFGNGAKGGNVGTLYFTAGIAAGGNTEDHGLFGSFAPTIMP